MKVNPFFAGYDALELDEIEQIFSEPNCVFQYPKRQFISKPNKKLIPYLPEGFYDAIKWASEQSFGIDESEIELRFRWNSAVLYLQSYYPAVVPILKEFGGFYQGFGKAYIINHALHAIEIEALMLRQEADQPEVLTPYRDRMNFYAQRRARMAELRVAIREHRANRDKELFEVKQKWEQMLLEMKAELAAIENSSLQESVANVP